MAPERMNDNNGNQLKNVPNIITRYWFLLKKDFN